MPIDLTNQRKTAQNASINVIPGKINPIRLRVGRMDYWDPGRKQDVKINQSHQTVLVEKPADIRRLLDIYDALFARIERQGIDRVYTELSGKA